jgi:hypothetical protein
MRKVVSVSLYGGAASQFRYDTSNLSYNALALCLLYSTKMTSHNALQPLCAPIVVAIV